jgi:predicted phage terminase large subunit-like protein
MSFCVADRLIARASPAGFGHVVSAGAYVPFEHLLLLDRQLTEMAAGRCPRLIVSMPPRHGKSETISRYLPAWYLGRFPDRRVMLASYEAQFAASWGRKARECLEAVGEELFDVVVSARSAAASAWELEGRSGGMVTAGVGGPLTGKGADLLIIDDPIKNNEEAGSQLLREKSWDWWRSTARTRLQGAGAVVIVMTRWHEDDLVGRLLAQDAELAEDEREGWEVVELPALAEAEGDALGRESGEPLCPELGFDSDWARKTRATTGGYWWAALYQQRPRPPEGMMFKRADFRYFEERPEEDLYVVFREDGSPHPVGRQWCTRFQTVDVAASERQSADYTAIATWAATPDGDLLLLDIERERFESLDVGGFISRSYERHKPSFIGIESFGHGLGVVQELTRKGLPIRRLTPDKDKVSRALVAVARYEEHKVFHPRGHSGLRALEDELLAFPNAAHDDQVDAVGYAARELPRVTPRRTVRPRAEHKTFMGGLRDAEL